MDSYQKEIEHIQQFLKENPKGMTVTDISRKIKINRNSVAKYLDIMRTSGLVEMITFGPAKVFFPSRRVPIANMLNYSSDYILIFDRDLKITLINDTFCKFMCIKREKIIGQTIKNTVLSIFKDNLEISVGINEAFEGKSYVKEISFKMDEEEIYLNVKIVPTTFEDGIHGVTLIIQNITTHKIAENAISESEKNYRKILKKLQKN